MAEAIAGVLRARRIEVLDEDDVVRAVIQCHKPSDDLVVLELYGPKRSTSLAITAHNDGVGASFWYKGDRVASVFMDDEGDVEWEGGDDD